MAGFRGMGPPHGASGMTRVIAEASRSTERDLGQGGVPDPCARSPPRAQGRVVLSALHTSVFIRSTHPEGPSACWG